MVISVAGPKRNQINSITPFRRFKNSYSKDFLISDRRPVAASLLQPTKASKSTSEARSEATKPTPEAISLSPEVPPKTKEFLDNFAAKIKEPGGERASAEYHANLIALLEISKPSPDSMFFLQQIKDAFTNSSNKPSLFNQLVHLTNNFHNSLGLNTPRSDIARNLRNLFNSDESLEQVAPLVSLLQKKLSDPFEEPLADGSNTTTFSTVSANSTVPV